MYERIWELAKAKGLSIPALEKLASISPGGIGKWKTSMPKADALYRVATILETTMEYLLKGIPARTKSDGQVDEIMNLLLHADPDARNAIVLLLKSAKRVPITQGDSQE